MIEYFNGVIRVAAGEDTVLSFTLDNSENTAPIDKKDEVLLAIWTGDENPLSYKGEFNTIKEKWQFIVPATDTANFWGRAFYQIFVNGNSIEFAQPIYFC